MASQMQAFQPEDENSNERLSEIFSEAIKCQELIDKSELDSVSQEYQNLVLKGINLLERATKMVNMLSLFSSNEELEEIPTAHLKYLLLPAFLGFLTSALNTAVRKSDIERSVVYYSDFFRRIGEYNITTEGLETEHVVGMDDKVPKELADMAQARKEKITRLKTKKSLENKLKELESIKHLDEATQRDHILTTIRLWMTRSIDELESCKRELELLEMMAGKEPLESKPIQPPAPFKPIVITRDMIQQKVFGAGYPSVPTMSVEEWNEKRIRDGVIPPIETHLQGKDMSKWVGKGAGAEKEDEKGEISDEEQEGAKRRKDVQFDEFKDENKRGSGNRKNRS